MRIAILLSGYPRNYMTAYESLKAPYMDKYQCDFFIHSWYKDGNFDVNSYAGYVNTFKPVKFFLEKQITFDTSTQRDKWDLLLQNTLSQFYSVGAANMLKSKYEDENNFKYDLVMRMRPDLHLIRPIDPTQVDKNCIGLYKWTELGFGFMGLSDVFAIGPSNLMDVYADFYSKIKYYIEEDKTYNIPDDKTRPEYLLRQHLVTANNLPLQFFYHNDQTDRSWNFVR
jgi:hypothetical protein